jgi:hypothetical protein
MANDDLSMQYFGMNGSTLFGAIKANLVPLTTVSSTLNNKLVSVKVFYRDLSYTQIDQEPKIETTDL